MVCLYFVAQALAFRTDGRARDRLTRNENHTYIHDQTTHMSRKTNVRHWNSGHNDRLRALRFYKEEIDILDKRLAEIAGKNTAHEVAAQVEHFQNQFVLHRNNIDELGHSIREDLEGIGTEIQTQNGFIEDKLLDRLEKHERGFEDEEKNINALRRSFNLFSAEWM